MIPKSMLEQVARRFKLLGEPVRLEVLNLLHEKGEMPVQALVEATGQSHANVSKHLRLMLDAGFVARRKEGVYAYYSISDPTLSALCTVVCSRLREKAAGAASGSSSDSEALTDERAS